MVKLEINDKTYNIPESFEELSFEQYCRAFYKLPRTNDDMEDVEIFKMAKENEATILSRIMGEDDSFCLDLPLNVYARLVEAVQFIYDSDYFSKNAKAGVTIDGKRYSVPPMNEMSLRQYIDADVVLKENENPLQYIELLSILLTAKDKEGKWVKYNGDYQDMMGKLRKLKCSEALPIVYHFFKRNYTLKKLSQLSMKAVESQQPQHTANS